MNRGVFVNERTIQLILRFTKQLRHIHITVDRII
jgi:hypothetical protein